MSNYNYEFPNNQGLISASGLSELDCDLKKEIMGHWFHSNYENPAERTPFESSEGGYIYIWGGPYDAEEVLREEFEGIVEEAIICQLARELSAKCIQWAGIPMNVDYLDKLGVIYGSMYEIHRNFEDGLIRIESMAHADIEKRLIGDYRRLLYVSCISVLEAYLADAISYTILKNENRKRLFVENNKEFAKIKLTISDIYREYEHLDETIGKFLSEIVWHRLEKVVEACAKPIGLTITEDFMKLKKAISKRHDIVHRNGMTRRGEQVLISQNDIN